MNSYENRYGQGASSSPRHRRNSWAGDRPRVEFSVAVEELDHRGHIRMKPMKGASRRHHHRHSSPQTTVTTKPHHGHSRTHSVPQAAVPMPVPPALKPAIRVQPARVTPPLVHSNSSTPRPSPPTPTREPYGAGTVPSGPAFHPNGTLRARGTLGPMALPKGAGGQMPSEIVQCVCPDPHCKLYWDGWRWQKLPASPVQYSFHAPPAQAPAPAPAQAQYAQWVVVPPVQNGCQRCARGHYVYRLPHFPNHTNYCPDCRRRL